MKKVRLLVILSMILLLALTSCDMIFGETHEHEWTEATCDAPKTCECGETEGEALGHDWAEATCQTPKTCNTCNATEGEVGDHDYADATCTAPKTCKVCSETLGKALGHDWDNPTCTEPKTCKTCSATEGAANGHSWTEVTCDNPASVCEVCGEENKNPEINHTLLVHMEAVAPGCHYTGHVEYWMCYGCEGVWTDEALTQVSNVKNVIIPELGGEVIHVEAKEAACHQNGNIEYWYCATCEQVWQDEARTQLTNFRNVVVPFDGENIVHVEGKEAGCHQFGNLEYWYCSECNALFTDAQLTQLSNYLSVQLPYESENIVHVEGKEAGCHQFGNLEYWYCSECMALFTDAALTQMSNFMSVRLPYNTENIVHVEAKEAACHQLGNVEYWYCSECDALFTDAQLTQLSNFMSVRVPYTAEIVHVEAQEAACHQFGNVEYWYCSDCDAVFTDAALTQLSNRLSVRSPYTAEIIHVDAVANTCTENGNLEYWYCAECYALFTDAELIHLSNFMNVVVPAAHTEGTAATCTDKAVCSVCNEQYGEALGHNMLAATCDAPATCDRCGHTEGTAIATHTPVATVEGGKLTYACTTCNDSFTADQALIYDGNNKDYLFTKNGNVTMTMQNGQYDILVADGEAKAQYMFYGPSNDKSHKDTLTGFNAQNGSFGVLSFKIKMNVALKNEAVRIIVMSSRNNPNWDANGAWSGNSIDVLAFMPNFDGDNFNGTYRVYGNSMTSNTFTTVNADEWVDVQMFMQFSSEGVLTVGYYINGVFCNTYTRDCTADDAPMAIRNLDINCVYICGYAGAGTGLSLDDLYMGYAKNTEWLFDEHEHVFSQATCTEGSKCVACGLAGSDALGHNYTTRNENVVEPDCVNNGKHDVVTYCSNCGEVKDTQHVVDKALGHTEELVPGYAATCLENGLTDGKFCTVCQTTTVAQQPILALGHKDADNDKTCDACQADLNCKHEGELEEVKGHAPTCTENGLTDGVKCTLCGDFTEPQESIPALGHKNAEAVRENAVAPTCTTDGHYDSVVYCSVCNAELSREKNVVDPMLGHEEVKHDGKASTCTEKGWNEYVTCTRCDYNTKVELPLLAHSWIEATCVSGKSCTVCGQTGGDADANAHNLVVSYATSTPTYSCTKCDYKFVPKTYDYNDGTNYTGFHCNAATNNTVYTTNGSNYPVQKDGYLEFVRTDAETGAQKQLQMWAPSANGGTNKFSGFSSATNSVGYLSFKLNAKTDVNFEWKLVDHRVDEINGTKIRWGDEWAINDPVFRVMPEANGKVEFRGFNGHVIGTFDVDENGYSGWVDVAIQIVLDPDTDKVIAHYYVNGNYAGTQSRDLTTHTNAIQGVYINFNSKAEGCGYKLDDFVFGYRAHEHYFAADAADSLTYTCACGTKFVADEYLGWDGEGTDSGYRNVPNGNVELTLNNGKYEYIFKPYTDVAPDFSAAGNQSADGWFEYDGKGYAGGQLQMWMPSNNRGENGTFTDFSCENNAVGIISFDMSSSLARHPDWDTSLTFSVGKPRNASDWSEGGSWTDDSINIFTVEEYQESGLVLKGGLNGTNLNFGAIVATNEDGWSDWFNVMIVIEMTDNGYLTVYYYINGEYVGSDSRDLNNPGGYRTLNPKKIEALQISGWTYAPNTGVKFDNFYFGYTTQGHNTLDGQTHKLTETTCGEKSTCSCGWTGYTVAHTFASACAPACAVCGLANNHAAAHATLTTSVVDGKVQYACTTCNMYYAADNYGLYYDGSDKIGVFSHNNEIDLKVEDGYNRVYMTESDGTYHGALGNQHMLWIPSGSTPAEFDGFTNANNATGLLSFKIKGYSDTNNIECKINDARGTNAFDWSKTSVSIFSIAPVKDPSATTTNILGLNGQTIGSVPVGEDHWTEWLDVVIVIHLTADNMISVDYYLNGEYYAHIKVDMPINTYKISSFYINGYVKDQNGGYCLDDVAFGYTTGAMHEIKAPFYTEKITDVTSETLQTIVASKFKQCDQCTEVNKQGGTPVYVLAEKDGEQVEALYVSRTYAWAGNEAEQFTEFRFAINGESSTGPKVTSLSFDYKIDGTVEKNERYQFTDLKGEKFYSDAYVQIKTAAKHELAGDDYPELSGTDLVLDGEWHTVSVTFDEPLQLKDFLLNLYHFQGELLIANIELTYAE